MDGALIGFVGLRRDNREKVRHKAQVWGLYVRQSMRQQGVAKALLQAAIAAARALPEISSVLLSVDSESVTVKKLYVSLEFEVYGIERDCMLVDGMYVHEPRNRS